MGRKIPFPVLHVEGFTSVANDHGHTPESSLQLSARTTRPTTCLEDGNRMTVSAVECAWISLPLATPRGVARGTLLSGSDAVCRITTRDGVEGIGQGQGEDLGVICKIIDEALRPIVQSQPEEQIDTLWHRMYTTTLGQGVLRPVRWKRRAALAAIGMVDQALWDIRAKQRGVPLCEELGGICRPIPAYLSDAFYVEGQSLEEMVEDVRQKLAQGGYAALKVHIGRHISASIERIGAIRKGTDDSLTIMADASQAWDLTTASRAVARLEPLNLRWLEEPIYPHGGNYRAHAGHDANGDAGKLSARTTIPLALGENHVDYGECRDLAERGGISFMQFAATANGGVTEWLRVARFCHERGIAMAPHHAPHFHVHLVAAVPHGAWVQCLDNAALHPTWPNLFEGFPEVENGTLTPPDRPGWGMRVNDEFLRTHGTLVSWRC